MSKDVYLKIAATEEYRDLSKKEHTYIVIAEFPDKSMYKMFVSQECFLKIMELFEE